MATTKELNEAVNEYQNTEQTAVKEAQETPEYKPFTIQLPKIGTVAERMRALDLQAPLTEDYTQEAVASGFGTSRYDNEFYSGKDLEHNRALEQPAFAKIGLGIVKGGVTTAATAVNTTLGVLFGTGSALYELAADTNGNGASFMDTLDAGVNNWLSNQLVALQDWSETAMPNYRTAEERSEKYQKEWYKHMGTANFIGDSLLKNFGFTLGAMGGGMVWSKILSRGMSKLLANNVMKGAVAAASGNAEISGILQNAAAALRSGSAKGAQAALGRAAQAVERGTAVAADYTRIANNIKQAARGINKMNAQLQLYGAAIGAMGEGTVEGVMARNEFMEDYTAKLNRKFAEEYRNVERDILNSGNKYWVATRVMQSPDGGIYDEQFLTEAGQKHVEYLRKGLTEHYANEKEFAEEQGRRLASTTYLLNLPVLTASNLVQFGRMFSGGWSTARKNLVKGGIGEAAGSLTGAFADKGGSIAARGALGSVKNALSEAFEEMAQGSVSSGAKQVASYRLADFNDQGYDDEATHSVRTWLENMYAGGKEYLGDIKNWQEGALGAITGLLGIPGRRWHGGVVGAVQDAREEINASKEAANTLNNLVNSKEFQDRWRGYIRHLKYDNDMENAIINDDEYAWHTADNKQLVSDVIAFASAGRLDDLKQVADHFAGITEADAQSIRDVQKKEDGNADDWTRNLSDAEIIGKVKKQAGRMKTAVEDYAELYDAIKTRAPMDASDEFINEMVFSAMHIKQSDRRFLELFGEVFDKIEPYLHVMATLKAQDLAQSAVDDGTHASVTSEGKTEISESEAKLFTTLRNSYETLFAGTLLPFRMPKRLRESMDEAFNALDELTKDDNDLNKKVNDLKKISEDRQQFFKKLQTLRENKVMDNGRTAQEKFEQEKMTQEKQDIEAEQVFAQEETKGLESFADIQQAYNSKNARDKVDFLDSIRAVADKNPAAKKFLDLKQRWDSFNEYLNTKYLAGKRLPFDSQSIAFMTNGMLRLAKSEEELINVPDNLLPSYDEFVLANKRVVMGVEMTPSMEAYAQIKQTIRDAMDEYLDTESRTASRKNIKPDTPEERKKQEKKESALEGPDKPQPANENSAPEREQGHNTGKEQDAEKKSEPELQESTDAEPDETDAIVDNPTESDLDAFVTAPLANDMEIGSGLVAPPRGGRGKVKAYYNTSMPEVPSLTNEQRAKLRTQKDKAADVDLRDFAEVNSAFAEQWNALDSVHGFDNIVTELETGDEIEFVIDPDYPKYEGEAQILLAVEKTIGGKKERKYLNVLSRQTGKYYGLRELREAIFKEYEEFIGKHPNQVFVFSKKSKCWIKRNGLVDYDRTFADRDVRDIPKFNPDAPIGFIDLEGQLYIARGRRKDKSALQAAIERLDVGKPSDALKERVGMLFYFVKIDRGRYCPIGLGIEHFKIGNRNDTNTVFAKIRTSLSKISELVKETTAENIGEQNKALYEERKALDKYLNLNGVYFEIRNYTNIGIALKIVNNYRSKKKKAKDAAEGVQAPEEKTIFIRPDQMSADRLINAVARLGKSVNLKIEDSSIQNFDEFFNAGMITSNARMLRPKGMDFYFDAYNPETGQFEKMTADQVRAEQEFERQMEDIADSVEKDKTISEQLIEHLKSQGINVYDRAAMEEYLKSHDLSSIQAAYAGSQLVFVHGVRKPEGIDVFLLSSAIKTQANTFEHLTESLQDNTGYAAKRVILFGDNAYLWSTENGYEFFVEQALLINEKNYDKINRLLDTYGTDEFTTTAIDSIQRSKDKETRSRSLAEFAKRERSGENSGPVGQNSRKISEISNTARNNGDSLANTEGQITETFTTPQGEVYGFVDNEGNIYLDETKISPEQPIHEYAHLWDRAVQKNNPAIWKTGVELMKQIDLWGKIAEDKNYGEAWRGRGIAGEELENLIASEVHARLVGERGKEILNQIAQEKGKANIVEKLKAWALEFWKNLKSAFSNWSEDDLRYLTIDDFNHMTVRDFAEGVNLNKIVAEVVKGHQGREINGEALDVTELVGSQSEGSESGDRDNDDSTPTEAPDGAEAAEDTRQAPEYDELAKWQQAVMKKKGYDEELFDTMDGESQDQKIECLHV